MARPKIDQIANLQTQLTSTSDSANNRVLKTGDTISGQLTIDTSGFALTANVADGNDAARFKSPTRTLAITPYYNSEGNDYGTWFEAFTTSGGSYSKMTLMGSDIILNSQGNTGIAVLSPTSKLHVSGNANITSGLVVDGSTLVVDATNNRVGVGIATPSTPLEVVADGSSGLGITIRSMPDEFGSLRFRSNNGSTTFGELAVDYGGSIYLASVTNLPLKLKTNNTDRVHIDATGNVGIGTTDPTANLHVTGTIKDTPILSVTSSGTYADNAAGRVIFANTTSAITITAAAAATAGFSYTVIRGNTGNVTIANSGVTRLNSASITTMNVNQYGAVTVVYTATNQVIVFGDFVA